MSLPTTAPAPAVARPAPLYQLCQQRWTDAERRAVVDRDPDASSVWLLDVTTATEMEIRDYVDDEGYYLTVVDIVTETATHLCYCTPTEQGQVVLEGRPAAPVPDEVIRRVRSARLLPPADVIYGYRRGDRTVALIHTWLHDIAERPALHDAMFVLAGATPPELHTTRHDRTYLDAARWWAAVDRGAIVALDRAIADSRYPVDTYQRQGAYRDICARGTETWTGVEGPALYSCQAVDGVPAMTLAETLEGCGEDIRALQALSARRHGR